MIILNQSGESSLSKIKKCTHKPKTVDGNGTQKVFQSVEWIGKDQVLSCYMHKSAIMLNYITEDLQSRFKETTHTISTTNQSSLVGMCASVCFPSCMSVGLLSICRFNHISLVWEDFKDWSCLTPVRSSAVAKYSGKILTKRLMWACSPGNC